MPKQSWHILLCASEFRQLSSYPPGLAPDSERRLFASGLSAGLVARGPCAKIGGQIAGFPFKHQKGIRTDTHHGAMEPLTKLAKGKGHKLVSKSS